ncbi:MAG: restriction endonuclease [bacterium]
MKVLRTTYLIKAGPFGSSPEWETRHSQICKAITNVEWPTGSGTFTLHSKKQSNGVVPIKKSCMGDLKRHGWSLETRFSSTTEKRPGPIDATCVEKGKLLCLEWETGNISSSHRALNKMALGLITGEVVGGVLIIPSRSMYTYLTDRIGNYAEIQPYFRMWQALTIKEGVLAVIEIEHDALSLDVPHIPKGTDGRALR